MELRAPVVAVTVHPANARVTRRGSVDAPAGVTELTVPDLPDMLLPESVRAGGRAPGSVRIVGVDVRWTELAESPDERVRAAEAAVARARQAVTEIDAAEAGDAARLQLLNQLSTDGGKRLAWAFAEGNAEIGRIAELGAAVTEQVAQATVSRAAQQERRVLAARALDAAQAELDRLSSAGSSRRLVAITVEADEPARLELELTYVVEAASWTTAYDARLGDGDGSGGDEVALTWYAMITQLSGEDWPECEVTLSTARPARTATLPELDPWWVDVYRPPVPLAGAPMAARAKSYDMVAAAAPAAVVLEAAPMPATEHSVAGAWRLARPVAVPADGSPHRTTVTTMTLPAKLDHLTAPAVSLDAYLRATLTNSGAQVLLAGPAATFLDDAFVGTTRIAQTAPGEEIELALGVDDRVVVERELVDRTARKARFGSQRSSVESWRTTVTNRRSTSANVTVRDRVPVTRNADLKIVDVALTPDPAEHDELGRVEWSATIAPGATWTATARFGVESPKDTPLTGWQ